MLNGLMQTLASLNEDEIQDVLDEYGPEAVYQCGLMMKAQHDCPEGFGAFFEFMEGFPLHSEGRKWIENAYYAHSIDQGLLQECHREAGKTTVFSKSFMLFRMGHEPHKTWGVIRVNDDKANETTAEIARIIEHDARWKLIFPSVVPDPVRGWGAKGYYLKRSNVGYDVWLASRVGATADPTFVGYGWSAGGVIGSRFSGGVVVDDIHNEENVNSERMRSRIKTFATDVLEFCLMKGAWEIWNFTPWNDADVYSYLKTTGEYVHSKTPVMLEASETDEGAEYWPPVPLNPNYPDYGDIPLSGRFWIRYWPEMWSWERIASKYRKAGQLGFARMMLLDLEAAKGLDLKGEWLHRYPASDIDPSWPVYFGIDYASTSDKTIGQESDYFALAIMRALPGGGLVLMDGYRGRISKGDALSRSASYAAIYPTLKLIGVESISEGRAFYSDLLLTNDVYGQPLPLFAIKSHGRVSKGDRFEQWLGPRFQMARIWVSSVSTPFIEEFIEEWLTYPNAPHDDTLDAVYMASLAGEGRLHSSKSKDKEEGKKPTPTPLSVICKQRQLDLTNRH